MVKRVPRYSAEHREDDAQHSFMLVLIAQEIAETYFPEYDTAKIMQFCAVHDLGEIESGDKPTFKLSKDEQAEKEITDKKAVEEICKRLPPVTRRVLIEYEKQDTKEARFVRHLDKLLPIIVAIIGPGTQVVRNAYGVHTKADLEKAERALNERFAVMFTHEAHEVLHAARDYMASIFSQKFEQDSEEREAV